MRCLIDKIIAKIVSKYINPDSIFINFKTDFSFCCETKNYNL